MIKKSLTIIASLLLSVLFTACAKIPFEKQTPLNDAALVYIYVAMDSGMNDTQRMPLYKIGLNGKDTEGYVKHGAYKFFNLRAGEMTISAARNSIEKQKIDLNLTAGNTYFLKVRSFSDDFAKFEIVSVESDEAYSALMNTTLADEYEKSENIITELITPEKEEVKKRVETVETKVAPVTSKMDEIQKAFEMKEKGMLSEEEFKTLKAEILAK